MTVFMSLDELREAVGRNLGHSEWTTIDQARVDAFAGATGDHQWIHVDAERAKDGPFGTTVAHGFLTLSLVSRMLFEILEVRDARLAVNYGCNRVRFPAPVPVGSRVRGDAELVSADDFGGGLQTVITVTIAVEGASKPSCVAESVMRWYR